MVFCVSRGQVTSETLVILAVTIVILLSLVGMVYGSFSTYYTQEQVKIGSSALRTLVNEINDSYFLGEGTVKNVVIRLPDLVDSSRSSINGRSLVLSVAGSDLIGTANVDVFGAWPSSGTHVFVLTTHPSFVTVSTQKIGFSPAFVSETLSQGASMDLNLIATNYDSSALTYTMSISFPDSGSGATVSSASVGSINFSAGSSTTIPLSLACSVSSFGSYSGNIVFVSSSGDNNMYVPLSVVCSSSQTKLAVFPSTKSVSVSSGSSGTASFSACNNTDLVMSSVSFSSTDANSFWLSFPDSFSLNPFSCSNFDVTVSVPSGLSGMVVPIDFSIQSNRFVGYGAVSASIAAGVSGVSKLWFASVTTSDLNHNYGYDGFVKLLNNSKGWSSTNELDWNKQKSFPSGYDANLVAYYKFDDTNGSSGWVADLKGDHNAQLINGANLSGLGVFDSNAAFFDGYNDYIQVGNIGNVKTISFWVKPMDNNSTVLGLSSSAYITTPRATLWKKLNNVAPYSNDSNTYSSNGTIPHGVSGFDYSGTRGPSVIYDNNVFKMWYSGYDGSYYYTLYAFSYDANAWQKYGNHSDATRSDNNSYDGRIMPGIMRYSDQLQVYGGTVMIDNNLFKTWYTGYDPDTYYRIYYATSIDGNVWTKYDNNKPNNSDTVSTNGRIPLGTTGKGDASYSACPSVIKDGNTFKMWYSGYGGSYRIYYATSPDGLTWTKYDNSIPSDSNTTGTNGRIPLGAATSGDAFGALCPRVIKDGSTYKMWYTGYPNSQYPRIYYATSPDGLTWTKYDTNRPIVSNEIGTNGRIPIGEYKTDGSQAMPGAVVHDVNGYKMFYSGYDGSYYRIYEALSSDGISWVKRTNYDYGNSNTISTEGRIPKGSGSVGDNYSAGYPSIIYDSNVGLYKMWYSGFDGSYYRIYYATSPDGNVWTKYNNSTPSDSNAVGTEGRIPKGAAGSGDSTYVLASSVIYRDGNYRMWYTGYASSVWRIFYATSVDGNVWTKVDNSIPSDSNTTGTNGRIPRGLASSGDSTGTAYPFVIYDSDSNLYKMWYSGYDGSNWRVFHATSPDGLTWTKYNNRVPTASNSDSNSGRIALGTSGRWDASGVRAGPVIVEGGVYKMWYVAYNGTNYGGAYATSPDGLTWTKYDNNTPSRSDTNCDNGKTCLGIIGQADHSAVAFSSVIKDGNFHMFYSGFDGANWRIFYATSIDGLTWYKRNNFLLAGSDTTGSEGRIPLGSSSKGDASNSFYPAVVNDNNVYKMFYTGAYSSSYRIYYAYSANLLDWNKYDNNIPDASDFNTTNGRIALGRRGMGDSINSLEPAIIKDGNIYKAWYTGNDGYNNRIFYATSSDGIYWLKYDSSIPERNDTTGTNGRIPLGTTGKGDDAGANNPFVLKDGNIYRMWYTGYNNSSTLYRIFSATSPDGLTWTKMDNSIPSASDVNTINGRIALGSTGKGDVSSVADPTVIYENGVYKMWYGGSNGNWRVYYATSVDGNVWTKYDNTTPSNSDLNSTNGKIPLGTSGKGDQSQVSTPTVVKVGNTYYMWYGGNNGSSWAIFWATSSDGLTWTKQNNTAQNRLNGYPPSTDGRLGRGTRTTALDYYYGSYDGAIIKDENMYKLWYSGWSTYNRIGYATSPDGLAWTKYDNNTQMDSNTTGTNGRIPRGLAGSGDSTGTCCPSVMKENGVYRMWYSGYDGTSWRIFYATSPDGLTWTKYDTNIPPVSNSDSNNGRIPLGTSGRADSASAIACTVIKDGNIYRMWYTGGNYILYATSPDGLSWKKNNLSPVNAYYTDATIGSGKLWPSWGNTYFDGTYVYSPSVIKDGNSYRMFYRGYNQFAGSYLGSAYSSTGMDWHKFNPLEYSVSYTMPTQDTNKISNYGRVYVGSSSKGDYSYLDYPFLMKDGSTYKLWYMGSSAGTAYYNLFYAYSSDGWPNPTYYINGKIDGYLWPNQWNHVAVVDTVGIDVNDLNIGVVNGYYFGGNVDELKLYNRALSESEIVSDFNSFANAKLVDSNIIGSETIGDWNTVKVFYSSDFNFNKELQRGDSLWDSNLIGLWHLDDNTNDSSSTANHGTNYGGVVSSCLWGTSCYDLNGSGAFISIPHNSLYNTDGKSITLSAWINFKDYTKDSYQTIISKRHPGNNDGAFWLYVLGGSIVLSSYSNIAPTGTVTIYSTTGVLGSSGWHHVVVTKTWGQINAKMYVDGVRVSTKGDAISGGTNYAGIYVDFGATRIGSDMNAYAEGKIEEVAIWNRLLSESEVKELYRKGATRLDLNLYTCSDSACANKTSSLYVSDLNNKSVVDISSLPDSKYLGFDVLFRQNPLMIDENHTLNRFVYPSYIRDINISYVG